MKKLLLTSIIALLSCFVFAQSWNPYLSQGIISPSPLSTVESDGTGVVSFNVGNTGSSILNLDRSNPDSNLVLIISLSNGIPNVNSLNKNNALKAISGTWADMFKWEYDMISNTYKGIQIRAIPGISQGSVIVQYKVTTNSPKTKAKNGFEVKLMSPPYSHVTNSINDDGVSSYTWTETR
jgi:hypothetical protein